MVPAEGQAHHPPASIVDKVNKMTMSQIGGPGWRTGVTAQLMARSELCDGGFRARMSIKSR
jgi:hypothetical protein